MKKKKDIFKEIFRDLNTNVGISGVHKHNGDKKRSGWMAPYESDKRGMPTPFKGHHGISIWWTEKGRGFGEYSLWQEKGKTYIDSEIDGKYAVMKAFCMLIDKAIDTNPPTKKKK
jgi:hypothetical protein